MVLTALSLLLPISNINAMENKQPKKYSEDVVPEENKNNETNPIIKTAEDEINETLDQINNLSLDDLKIKKLKNIENTQKLKEIKESKNTNKKIEKLYHKALYLEDLTRAKIVIKAAEKDILNTENLIKEIESKKRITKETEDKIKNLNERFKTAKKYVPRDLEEFKKHIATKYENFVFFTEELKTLVDNLENLHNKHKEANKELNIFITKFSETNPIIKTAENEINETLNKINNLNSDELKRTIKKIETMKQKLKEIKESKNTNKKISELYWKTGDLRTLLKAYVVVKAAEKDILNTENLIKEIESKKEITKETEDKIKNLNERFKIANNNIPVYLKKYKEHIAAKDKNFVFFTEELKTLVDNLENLHNKYKEANKELNTSLQNLKKTVRF